MPKARKPWRPPGVWKKATGIDGAEYEWNAEDPLSKDKKKAVTIAEVPSGGFEGSTAYQVRGEGWLSAKFFQTPQAAHFWMTERNGYKPEFDASAKISVTEREEPEINDADDIIPDELKNAPTVG